jgi:phosphatidylglycerol lysyltransferase
VGRVVTTALAALEPRGRAFELVKRFGSDTVSAQGLGLGYEYFFDGEDAVIAYVDTGGAWVAAGGPIAPAARIAAVAEHFADAAAEANRRACFFAAERSLADLGLPALAIGEQPVWTRERWPRVIAGSSSLRYQLQRARHKGVTVRRPAVAELASGSPLRAAVDDMGRRWQATHRMAPMRFLVNLEPWSFAHERLVAIAEHEGAVVGLASAIPVYARDRLFVEHLVRSPLAPNGTAELLVDAVIRASPAPEVTLGLAPLAGPVAGWLRFARWAGAPFYDFAGLRAFKAKLGPDAWEPIYLCAAPGGSRVAALRDSLRAFAGGSLFAFAGRTLFRGGRTRE